MDKTKEELSAFFNKNAKIIVKKEEFINNLEEAGVSDFFDMSVVGELKDAPEGGECFYVKASGKKTEFFAGRFLKLLTERSEKDMDSKYVANVKKAFEACKTSESKEECNDVTTLNKFQKIEPSDLKVHSPYKL